MAAQYLAMKATGHEIVVLNKSQMAEVFESFKTYGQQRK